MTDTKSEWHGMPHAELEKDAAKVPPNPKRGPEGMLEDHGTVYPRVYFSGNYGVLCGQFQEFWKTNITRTTAQQVAWSAFGLCGHSIRYYDANGNVVH